MTEAEQEQKRKTVKKEQQNTVLLYQNKNIKAEKERPKQKMRAYIAAWSAENVEGHDSNFATMLTQWRAARTSMKVHEDQIWDKTLKVALCASREEDEITENLDRNNLLKKALN